MKTEICLRFDSLEDANEHMRIYNIGLQHADDVAQPGTGTTSDTGSLYKWPITPKTDNSEPEEKEWHPEPTGSGVFVTCDHCGTEYEMAIGWNVGETVTMLCQKANCQKSFTAVTNGG